jgi:undecaprenyl diphosphate synthase
VRTSGERRLSDFLPAQSSLAQLQFVPRLWPEMDYWALAAVILRYQRDHAALLDSARRVTAVRLRALEAAEPR